MQSQNCETISGSIFPLFSHGEREKYIACMQREDTATHAERLQNNTRKQAITWSVLFNMRSGRDNEAHDWLPILPDGSDGIVNLPVASESACASVFPFLNGKVSFVLFRREIPSYKMASVDISEAPTIGLFRWPTWIWVTRAFHAPTLFTSYIANVAREKCNCEMRRANIAKMKIAQDTEAILFHDRTWWNVITVSSQKNCGCTRSL